MNMSMKTKKKVEIPPELQLEVLKDIKASELLERYYFPNTPLEPWYEEDELAKALDQQLVMKGPPPCAPLSTSPSTVDSKTARDLEVLDKLNDFIREEECKFKKDMIIKEGDFVDIKSLLFPHKSDYLIRRKRRGFVKRKHVEGKYIMICCCYAPAHCDSSLWTAVYGCSNMYTKLYPNFEMVLVIRTRPGWGEREKDVFRQTFSAFPPPCLAVPLNDRSRRRNICYSVCLANVPKILLVAPDGKALLNTELGCFLYGFPLIPFDVNGSDDSNTPFPFLNGNITTPSSLKGLLFQSTETVFRKKMINSGTTVSFIKEEVSLSHLNSNKHLALYLYYSGDKLPLLRHIHQGCRQTNKDLEVVVVYLPTHRTSPSFPEVFSTLLAKRELPWWVLPYNFTASTALTHIFQVEITWERVIIVLPNDQYVDLRGLRFMQIYGVDAYPFTFKSVVQKTVEQLSQITLDLFLELLQLDYPPSGNKALFYFDFPHRISFPVYEQAVDFLAYNKVQLHFTSLVDNESFVRHANNFDPDHPRPRDFTHVCLWHTKGANKIKNFFLRFFNHVFPTIVAFGEDGRICSLLAHKIQSSDGSSEIKGNLLEEVSSILENFLILYDRIEYHDGDGAYDHRLGLLQELMQSQLS